MDANGLGRARKYVMAISNNNDLYVAWSEDSLTWSPRMRIENEPGESFYPTLIGPGRWAGCHLRGLKVFL